MGKKEDEFRQRLAAAFRIEAAEHVAAISSGLSALDSPSPPENAQEIIETTFREMHTLKGAARSVNETEIESLCQAAESALSALKQSQITFSRDLADLIYLILGRVNAIIEGTSECATSSAGFTTHDLIVVLEQAASGKSFSLPPAATHSMSVPENEKIFHDYPTPVQSTLQSGLSSSHDQSKPVAPEPETRKMPESTGTVRVTVSKMDAILLRAEEMIACKGSFAANVRELESIAVLLDDVKKDWLRLSFDIDEFRAATVAEVSKGADDLFGSRKLADFAEQNLRILRELDARIVAGSAAGRRELHTFSRKIDVLLSEIREIMLVPADSVLMFLPLTVQEMAASMGKEVGLVIEGGDRLVDRRILEGMKEPLIHLVRNAVDHGIENPEERGLAGKPTKGKIIVSLTEQGSNRIELTISDDGRGIDCEQIKDVAQKHGIVEKGELEQMNGGGILRLLFRSGLSTSPIITELSGRGLGLAIVEEQVEQYDGDVTIESSQGNGTRVQITLPVRLATLRGVIVRARDQFFIIPRIYVEQVLRIDEDDVHLVENRRMIRFRDETIPLISLAALLALPCTPIQQLDQKTRYVTVIAFGATRIALEVDEILREQEFSQKCLGPQLVRINNIAGAVIGHGGRVIPVLNIADLIKSAGHGGLVTEPEKTSGEEPPKVRNLLVVEDSITARALLKNILETAGYTVKTAVDGMDAWTVLKTDPIDLVVSDIQMPRMNGFDLTAAIRHDRDLAELPVVLVTALSSQKDREQGIDAGANAYIVKGSFDQSNLIDIIRRLIG